MTKDLLIHLLYRQVPIQDNRRETIVLNAHHGTDETLIDFSTLTSIDPNGVFSAFPSEKTTNASLKQEAAKIRAVGATTTQIINQTVEIQEKNKKCRKPGGGICSSNILHVKRQQSQRQQPA